MPIVEGNHDQSGTTVRYRAEYEVSGSVIRYTATFGTAAARSTHEGQFDFDPARLEPADAVDAFMSNHIAKADFDAAP